MLKGGGLRPLLTTRGNHETPYSEQAEIPQAVQKNRLQNEGDQRRSATDPRRLPPLTTVPCNYPGTGQQAPSGALTYYGHIQKSTGKIPPCPSNYREFPLPCGRCTGCKLERSRQWAVRLMHEAQLHKRTSFLTVTYDDKHLPLPAGLPLRGSRPAASAPGLPHRLANHARAETCTHESQLEAHHSLSRLDLQRLTKCINEDARRRFGNGVKYYACGEYGDKKHRPHYHIALFGQDFSDDRYKWKRSKGKQLWRSSRLEKMWGKGEVHIGALTFESAAYVARYIMKKITGKQAPDHYLRINEEGEEIHLQPEFNVMSRRPGIARQWFLTNYRDVFPHDHVISRGHPAKPPRYYDKLLEALAPYEREAIKQQRLQALEKAEKLTPAQLEAREIVTLASLNQNKRSLE